MDDRIIFEVSGESLTQCPDRVVISADVFKPADIVKRAAKTTGGTQQSIDLELGAENMRFIHGYLEGCYNARFSLPHYFVFMNPSTSDNNQESVRPARPVCPRCSDAKAVVPIFYGHFSRKGIEELRKEYGPEYVLGGCSIEPGLERWHCKTCGHDFGDIFDVVAEKLC
jgi:hypothetical protein